MRALARLAPLAALCCGGGGGGGGDHAVLERAIAHDLQARFGTLVVTRCFRSGPSCVATLADGTTLPIALTRSAGAWQWQVTGLVIAGSTLDRIVHDHAEELGAPQAVRCPRGILRIDPEDRISCALGGGGAAFVTVHADGAFDLELVLDPASARARAEPVTPARDRALIEQSTALERDESSEDDDGVTDVVLDDAGVGPDGQSGVESAP